MFENIASLDEIVINYGELVTSICRRMLRNEEDAKDAAQQAWIEIIDGLPSFKGNSKLSTWVYTVTYHSVLRKAQNDRIYSTKFLSDYFHGEELEIPQNVDYDHDIWIKDMCDKCLTGILHCLDFENRMAYILRDIAQLSYNVISEIIGKDSASIRKSVERSRNKLKSFLNEECALYNPNGTCRCRMKKLVTEIRLPEEYAKLRKAVKRINVFLESQHVMPATNYWKDVIA